MLYDKNECNEDYDCYRLNYSEKKSRGSDVVF